MAADNHGCFMSFTGDNGATVNGAAITTSTDARSVGGMTTPGADGSRVHAGSASFLVTTSAGTTTLTGTYRTTSGAQTATFTTNSIIVQTY
jgi:hypothetical protein